MPWLPSPTFFPGPNRDFTTYTTLKPDPLRDEAKAMNLLTSYETYMLSPVPVDGRVVGDGHKWDTVTRSKAALPTHVTTARIAELSQKEDVGSRFEKLRKNQQRHVNSLLAEMNEHEIPSFEWTLAQLERQEQKLGHKLKETTILTLYIKKAPKEGYSALALYREGPGYFVGYGQHPVQQLEAPPPPGHHLNMHGAATQSHGGQGTHSHQSSSSSHSSGSSKQSTKSSSKKSHTGSSRSSKHSKNKHPGGHSDDKYRSIMPAPQTNPIDVIAELLRALPARDRRLSSRERYIEAGRERLREADEILEDLGAYEQPGRLRRRRDSYR